MDDYAMFAILEALDEAFNKLLWFSCGWFVVYALIGPWLKIKLVNLTGKDLPSVNRFGPVFISHILFSAALVNPYTMLLVTFKFNNILSETSWRIFLTILYFWILALALECLLLRIFARWRRLKWFQWHPPLKRVVPVSLLLSILGFGAGSAGIYMEELMPIVLRSFPIHPRAFDWKVNTRVKPLKDASLPAESDPIIADDKYVYIQVNAKQHQWRVVDVNSRKVLGNEAEALAYVLADDSGGTWQIMQSDNQLLCYRVFKKKPRKIPVVVDLDAIFFEHQIQGLIIGANPSSGYLFAFDPDQEKVLWNVRAPAAEGNNDRRIGSIAGTGDVIAVGLWTSRIWAVNIITGQSLWEFREDRMGNAMYVIASDKAVVGFSRSGEVYAFDPETGESKWTEQFGDLAGGIGLGNTCIYQGKVLFRNNNSICCINIETGQSLWYSSYGNHYSGGITCSTEGILACTSDRTLAMFNADTGEEIFRTKFPIRSGIEYGFNSTIKKAPGRIYSHPLILGNKQVHIFTNDGVLWALKPVF